MSGLPTRERTEFQKNQPPRPNIPPRQDIPPRQNMPPRVVYNPGAAPQNRIRYEQLQRSAVHPRGERLSPIKPTKKPRLPVPLPIRQAKSQKKKKKKEKERTKVHEFLLGFVVGLIIFGTAAIFICSALIGLFT